ncbi:caldesmon-like [Ruditapes philippinarum]|uniref:caldesmon-like n=1 Tax=Ruditapes philippinarum TaxID=129788 RepID=UPI00295BBE06|nr:caldesmon-like [Ruditapes philippinarum]XP_060558940.1 caldesmon-like [Ruditapes philippinarum]XP_060558941.1 caldesmon-like [Ruditapes philippinarum]XP_060558942.1 caldesmon-like [Ruditapes philippinarum]
MFGQGGRGKIRTKLETLLRQDHSDVYFDNERLNDQLNLRIDDMQKELLRNDLQRGVEIGKLRQEIREFKALQTSNQEEKETAPRPHTSVGHSSRKRTANAGTRQRAQSAWARTQTKETETNAEPELPVTEEESSPTARSDSPSSSVSTLRNTKTLKKYRNIGASSFKENNRFPEEWYIKCLPASDAAIHNARKKVNGKFVAPKFGLLGKLREKEEMEKKLAAYSKIKPKLAENKNGDSSDKIDESEGMNLVCEEQVKPVLMSRRRLMEISNAENLVDRGPSRNTVRKQNLKDINEQDNKRINDKVKDFCKDFEERKASELKAMKEREEARRQDALEKIQLKAMEEAQLKKQEEERKKNEDDDDDDRFKNRWK